MIVALVMAKWHNGVFTINNSVFVLYHLYLVLLSLDDNLYILSSDEDGWLFAQSKDTGEQGFIPSNYVSQFGSLETQE